MGLREEVEEMSSKKFGPNTAKQFSGIGDRIDAGNDPKKYLDECSALLGKFLGPKIASNTFEPFYTKYAGEGK